MSEKESPSSPAPQESIQWALFLQSAPVSSTVHVVHDAIHVRRHNRPGQDTFLEVAARSPDLTIECTKCAGPRVFHHESSAHLKPADGSGTHALWFRYACRNCRVFRRLFSVLIGVSDSAADGSPNCSAVKVAEWPVLDDRMPDRALKLLGADRALFLQGRTAEKRGLGIGAMTYYRRVVERQKARIVQSIIDAAGLLGAAPEVMKDLEWARDSWRFEETMDHFKDAMPDGLRIAGQNPLRLLHDALSDGVHNLSDAECLKRADAARTVLIALAERIEFATKEEAGLHDAVKTLLNARKGSKEPQTE